ncbi:hypothetical protein C7H19_13780 [Aphanothece hegewaldii CCALA 016]|uniref:DUF4276 domain-containing protein n=1 Tax=Aphanothece hegewaldii CCALA 016 TaxID=2107694 RepID=A0A2T1LWU5_9CHRO|nr:hypothetical protein [Aphanothece hegewaldii]PSF36271.1 hypothetical protein C7H19_13780 [Aphanothece hegewaldii CCALA 016]
MNLYFLVEGRSTEKKLYPKWLQYIVPKLQRVKLYTQVIQNNYFILSGNGYPKILSEGIPTVIDHIQEVGRYNYLVICLDADEDTIAERKDDVEQFIIDKKLDLGNTQLKIFIQNRCIETWLLGNNKVFDSRQPRQSPLSDYAQYYDVSQNDPEKLGSYNRRNHADFHYAYLQAIFQAKNTTYTKHFPGEAQDQYYLEQLIKRTQQQNSHLKSFQEFINFCSLIKNSI